MVSDVLPGEVFCIVFYTPGHAYAAQSHERDRMLRAHGRFLLEQIKKGTSRSAGPFVGEVGGMAIIDVSKEQEAAAIVQHDPCVACSFFDYKIMRWNQVNWTSIADQIDPENGHA